MTNTASSCATRTIYSSIVMMSSITRIPHARRRSLRLYVDLCGDGPLVPSWVASCISGQLGPSKIRGALDDALTPSLAGRAARGLHPRANAASLDGACS